MICTGEIYKEKLDTLEGLNASCCRNLTSEKLQEILIQCKNLSSLYCYNCISLASLDLQENKKLTSVHCDNCKSLTSINIPENINLSLWCFNCPSLTSLNLPKGYHGHIDYSDCPWISQNEDFINNLQRLIKIQRWYRKLLIIKYLKSQEFIEWVYAPDNIGGRLYKKWLLKNLK